MSTTPITFRLSPEDLASALEGLIDNGHKEEDLNSITSIVRTTFFYGLIYLKKNPQKIANDSSLKKIKQIMIQNKQNKTIGIKDIMNKTNEV
jgi:hypothetical protein